jgi:hypothetical protein
MSSVVIPSANSWRMSSLVSRVMGLSAPGVRGIVVLHALVGDRVGTVVSESIRGRRKCFYIGQWMEVDVWPCTTLWLPCTIHRKYEGGQSHLRPLCLFECGQLKW